MPGINKNPNEMALVLSPQPSGSENQQNGSSNGSAQPRAPTSLQGLLRFAMEATKAEDAPGESQFQQMDETRKKWLEEALKSMTVDVIELLQKQIKKLEDVEKVKADDDITGYKTAFETILNHVDDIDTACDFHKIGGFMILQPSLKCPHPAVRAEACNLLAELCQNNPYCQRVVLDNEFVPLLVNMIENDEDSTVVVKALYALSAIVRHSTEGFGQFVHYGGPAVILKVIGRGDDKFVTKATFLLQSLCSTEPDFKSRIVFLGYVPALISVISKERQPSHEHALSLLAGLIEENTTAVSECRNPTHNLREVLQKYLENVGGKEECQEEEQYCKRILHVVFGLH